MNQANGVLIFAIPIAIVVIAAILVFVFRKKLTKKRLCVILITAVVVAALTVVGVLFVLDSSFAKDYKDDLRIELAQNDGIIIVKEWSFLTGSGAEIYYEKDGEVVCLGSTDGNDGYLAFDDGKYTVTEGDGEVTLSWFYSKVSGKEDWRSKTFKLTKD